MISDKSLQPLIWCIQFGGWIKIIPYCWRDGKIGVLKNNWKFITLGTGHLLAHFGYCAYFTHRMITVEPKASPAEIIMAIFFLGLGCMSLPQLFFNLLRSRDYKFYFNTLLGLNELSTVIFFGSSKRVASDGLELLNMALFTMALISAVLLAPAALYSTLNGFKVFRIIKPNGPFKWVGIFNASTCILICCLDWITVLGMVLTILIDTNSISKWIRQFNNSWKRQGLTNSRKATFRRLYRAYQIRHSLALDTVKYILPIVIPVAEMLLITSIFSVLRLFHSIGPINVVGITTIGIFTGVVLKMAIEVAVRVTETSRETQNLAIHPKCVNWLKIEDKQFFKSCRPFRFTVGSSFTLRKDSFVRIIDSVVITAVINLLLTF